MSVSTDEENGEREKIEKKTMEELEEKGRVEMVGG